MSDNGQPAAPLSLAQKLDAGRVRQLEQQAQQQATLLVTRAASDLQNITNTLQFLIDQANSGNPGARVVLKGYFDTIERARIAATGITLPAGAAPPGS
jgi:hypothetical protein